MTSEKYVDELRRSGVKLIKNDGSLTEIPPDFLKQATELCSQLRCSSISYDIDSLYQPRLKEFRHLYLA